MKKYYLLLGLIVGLFACTQEDYLQDDDSIATTTNNKSVLKKGGDGLYDLLGYAYDITGPLLENDNASDVAIIDVKRFADENPGKINDPTSSKGEKTFYYGANASDYLKDITTKTSVTAGINVASSTDDKKNSFTGTITANKDYQTKYSQSSKYSFASCDSWFQLKRIQFIQDVDLNMLIKYLTPEFIANVKSMSADALVNRYGTHVLLDISIGGRMNFIYSSAIENQSNYEKKTKAVKGGITAALGKVGLNFSTDMSKEEITSTSQENKEQKLTLRYRGGQDSGTSQTFDLSGNSVITVNEGNWVKSITPYNAALTSINKVCPIYDLITDPIKKAQIKIAVDSYIASKQIEILDIVPLYQYQAPYGKFYYDTNLHAPIGGYATIAGIKFQNDGIRCYVSPNTVSSSLIKSNNLVPLYQYQATGGRFYIDTYLHAPVGGYATIAGIRYHNDGIRCYVNLNTVPLSLINSNSLVPFYQYQKPYDVWDDLNQRGMFYYDTNLQIPIGANGTIASCTFHSDGIRCYVHPK